ncbi:unnamed protein product [Urochloa decumbens]|uniref:AP2/ERF and B3 domain-containing protein n=1 Tax=Urochloa decumbens TaxID=240449 RepID=A0ABC8Z0G7_9POAL
MAAFQCRFSAADDDYNSSKETGNDGGLVHQGPGHQPLRIFRGVVPQPNGRWGAQLYDGHERVWLGTFPDQDAVARAYDVAALRYRGREAATNFPIPASGQHQQQQLAFLAAHSKAEIVDMLRNQTYADELRRRQRRGVPAPPAWARVPLFEKAVTPSDVGKLSRLVVPRKHAEMHLPPVRAGGGNGGVLLCFVDGEGKVWRFRYSFWESSQSYVLSRGWIRFVRDKGLRAGDTVAFSRWTFGPDEQLLIDYRKKKQPKNAATADAAIEVQGAPVVVKLFGVDIAV